MPETNISVWLVWPVVAPLSLSLAAFVLGGKWNSRLGLLAVAAVVASVCVVTMTIGRHGPQQYPLGDWYPPAGIGLYADGLACAMLLMSAAVGSVVSVYSLGYFTEDRPPRFWPAWLILWSALNALFLSADIFNLYVTLELLTLAAIGLVVLAETREAVEAAMRYLLAALAGSLLYLSGVSAMYGAYGTLDIASLSAHAPPGPPLQAALLLMMLGLMLKTALFPLHFWLPSAHGSAPAPVSAVLSGLVVNGSFYILLRLWFDLFPRDLTRPIAMLPATLGAAAIVWGSVQALTAERLKILVAYSTVAQLGYLFLIFGLVERDVAAGVVAWSAGILFAVSHALAKASLFLAAGTIVRVANHDRIRDLPSVSRQLPMTFFAMGVAGVSLMGLPPTGAFVAKWMLLQSSVRTGQTWLASMIILGGLLAAAYLFRVLTAAFVTSHEPQSLPSTGVPRVMQYSTLVLALASLLLGLAAAPIISLLEIGSPWQVVQGTAP